MKSITEAEFRSICQQILEDRDVIIRNNPVGPPEEILLWMLLGILISYLSLAKNETPCFNGKPGAELYRDAIMFVLNGRMEDDFDPRPLLATLI